MNWLSLLQKNKIFVFFASVQLAIPLIIVVSLTVGIGTWIESYYNSDYAQLIIYNSAWVQILLGALWINIFCATISRFPLTKHQFGFFITHLGLLVLLLGAMITGNSAVSGEVALREGESTNSMTSTNLVCTLQPVSTLPTGITNLKGDNKQIAAIVLEPEQEHLSKKLYVKIPRFLMEQNQSQLSSFSEQLGSLLTFEQLLPFAEIDLNSSFAKNTDLQSGSMDFASLELNGTAPNYKLAEMRRTDRIPSAALKIFIPGSTPQNFWITEGSQKSANIKGKPYILTFGPESVPLPFQLTLKSFSKVDYPGSRTPMSFASQIAINNNKDFVNVSMNEPFHIAGYTVYQSSYKMPPDSLSTSIFSVSYDPGRPWKYTGSILLAVGILFLTLSKSRWGQIKNEEFIPNKA